ncbi:SLC13 family permease [Peptoniphilus equinus]|uniref:SLC13 family permease n=1 Tax=Peptoniphilus equinus TaxID=3016343 RepID=A0ABY7QTE1_9FIRM|nr:SLC13 family permease [Peptoniphilus equinus]WBW50062.1 SLC13 family permease [Peptoniphilus equinus]
MNTLIILAIITTIFIGYKYRYNVGIIAILFAYLFGAFGLDLSPQDILGLWPMKIFFVIFAVSLFYNFAVVNGTMDRLAGHLLYRFRHFPNAIYLIIYAVSVILSAMGAGFFTVMAVFCPIAMRICKRSNKNILIGAQAVNWGASGGANLMTSGSGIVFQGLLVEQGFEHPFSMGIPIFLFTIIYPFILLLGYLVYERLTGRSTTDSIAVTKPEPYTSKQKINIVLIIFTILLALVFPFLTLYTSNPLIHTINGKIDIGLVCAGMSVVALLLGLGDQKEVLTRVPWNTIVMLCGMGMLIEVAIAAGLSDQIGHFMNANVPPLLLPVSFCLVAGAMSFFSSTLSVVTPALFPVVGAMVALNPSLNPELLFTAVVAGSLCTNISPFSSAGSLMQMSAPTEADREVLFDKQLLVGMPLSYAVCTAFVFILTFIMG